MADITIQPQTLTGKTATTPTRTGSLSTGNNYFVPNNGAMFLHFMKSGAGACTVTIEAPGTVDGNAIADPTVSVPASTGDVMVGPFHPGVYNQADGTVKFNCSEITGLTVAALRVATP
jgi:hypothetical protein